MVVEGVLGNQLYIFTQLMFRQSIREKFAARCRSLPTAPDDPELVKVLAMFTSNPIYRDDA